MRRIICLTFGMANTAVLLLGCATHLQRAGREMDARPWYVTSPPFIERFAKCIHVPPADQPECWKETTQVLRARILMNYPHADKGAVDTYFDATKEDSIGPYRVAAQQDFARAGIYPPDEEIDTYASLTLYERIARASEVGNVAHDRDQADTDALRSFSNTMERIDTQNQLQQMQNQINSQRR
jgi:hypothetical protein